MRGLSRSGLFALEAATARRFWLGVQRLIFQAQGPLDRGFLGLGNRLISGRGGFGLVGHGIVCLMAQIERVSCRTPGTCWVIMPQIALKDQTIDALGRGTEQSGSFVWRI